MTTTTDLCRETWVKSSYSNGDGGNCIEFAPDLATAGVVPVRDSKNPTGPVLMLTPDAWAGLVAYAASQTGH